MNVIIKYTVEDLREIIKAKKRRITLEDIEVTEFEHDMIPTDIAATYIGSSRNNIIIAAQSGQMPFAFAVGSYAKIPKAAFINFMKYGSAMLYIDGLTGVKPEKHLPSRTR